MRLMLRYNRSVVSVEQVLRCSHTTAQDENRTAMEQQHQYIQILYTLTCLHYQEEKRVIFRFPEVA